VPWNLIEGIEENVVAGRLTRGLDKAVLHALDHFDPHGRISGGLRPGSRKVLQVSRRMSIDYAGRERVAIAHSAPRDDAHVVYAN
jgi:hypothetical protein